MDGFEENLVRAGLTGNEAKVYLELLKRGAMSANNLAKNLSMDRTLVYSILNNLTGKGMVSYVIRDKKKIFEASEPDNLLNPLKEKETFLKNFIKDLSQIKQTKDEKYEINIYEGKEGIRTFARLVMKHQNMYSFGATGRVYNVLYETPALAKELEKKRFSARVILGAEFKGHEMEKLKRIEVRYMDVKSDVTTSIFGDYVSIHIISEKPIVIVIKNKNVAEGYLNYFNELWKIAKP